MRLDEGEILEIDIKPDEKLLVVWFFTKTITYSIATMFFVFMALFFINTINLSFDEPLNNEHEITQEATDGEIPDKATFRNPQMRKALGPYFQLTQAVRTGNLARFNEVLEKFGDNFVKENTWTLIIR